MKESCQKMCFCKTTNCCQQNGLHVDLFFQEKKVQNLPSTLFWLGKIRNTRKEKNGNGKLSKIKFTKNVYNGLFEIEINEIVNGFKIELENQLNF